MNAGPRRLIVLDDAGPVSEEMCAALSRMPDLNVHVQTVDTKPEQMIRGSAREQIFECNTEYDVRRRLANILETYKGASRSTRRKLEKCAAARVRDLRAQAQARK